MQEKIKICHFTSAHKSNDVRIFLKECTSLAKAGFNVTLVAANCKTEKINGVQIIGVEAPIKNRFFRMFATSGKVFQQALQVDADIYHFHDPELLRFALRLKRGGKKIIYDAHEDLPKQVLGKFWINRFLRPLIAGLIRQYENYIASRLDCVVTATPSIRDRFKKVNPLSIDINNFPLADELSNQTEWKEKKNEVCYIGSISEIRGAKQIIEAMQFTNETKLNLAGTASPSTLYNSLKLIPSWNQVNDLGYIDREKATDIMSRSKAGIVTFLPQPNHMDAQPNKMFEYMSAGIPVIASHFPLWKEIIEGNKCGICVNPNKPEEIANAINYLLKNEAEAEQMGKNGRKSVLKKYNWEIENEKLINFYTQLIKTT